jgi:putative membrane protein
MSNRTGSLVGIVMAAAIPFAIADEHDDREFLTAAIAGDLAEIELGKLAQEKGQNERVREYGQRLVADHEKALQAATDAAEAAGIMPPEEPTPEARESYQRLARLSGAEFDHAFAQHMIMDHEKHIAAFREQASERGHESGATTHARATLPTLEEHLTMAHSLTGSVPQEPSAPLR